MSNAVFKTPLCNLIIVNLPFPDLFFNMFSYSLWQRIVVSFEMYFNCHRQKYPLIVEKSVLNPLSGRKLLGSTCHLLLGRFQCNINQ